MSKSRQLDKGFFKYFKKIIVCWEMLIIAFLTRLGKRKFEIGYIGRIFINNEQIDFNGYYGSKKWIMNLRILRLK